MKGGDAMLTSRFGKKLVLVNKNLSEIRDPLKDPEIQHFSWIEVYRACRVKISFEEVDFDE